MNVNVSVSVLERTAYLLGTKTSAFSEKRSSFASHFTTIVVWFVREYPHHRSKLGLMRKKLMLVNIMILIHPKHSHSIRFANYLFGVAKANN